MFAAIEAIGVAVVDVLVGAAVVTTVANVSQDGVQPGTRVAHYPMDGAENRSAWTVQSSPKQNGANSNAGQSNNTTPNKSKAQERADKLSEKDRSGKDFTKAGKEAVKDVNKEKNGGKTKCETCGIETVPATKDTRGNVPPQNRTEIDHIDKKRDNGSGTPNNGRVRCRGCNNNDDRPIK